MDSVINMVKSGVTAMRKVPAGHRPEPVVIRDQNWQPDTKFTFVDFLPSLVRFDDTPFSVNHDYHTLADVVKVATQWLKNHPDCNIVRCETVSLYFDNNFESLRVSKWNEQFDLTDGITNMLTEYRIVTALRLWVEKCSESLPPRTINYVDVKPEKKGEEGEMENLDDLFVKFNKMLKTPGADCRNAAIISMQSIRCTADLNWEFNTDAVLIKEESERYITFLRVFYFDNANREQINFSLPDKTFANAYGETCCIDLVPKKLSGGILTMPRFESFDELVKRATLVIKEKSDHFRFINVQTIDIKMTGVATVDGKQLLQSGQVGNFVRIMRIYMQKYVNSNQVIKKATNNANLNLKSLLCIVNDEFPSYDAIKTRLMSWFNLEKSWQDPDENQQWQLLTAETIKIFAKNKFKLHRYINECFYPNGMTSCDRCAFLAVRVYFDVKRQQENQVTQVADQSQVAVFRKRPCCNVS